MPRDAYAPPYALTDAATSLVAEIGEVIGLLGTWRDMETNPRLRRENRIRTIQASLAIERNSLSVDQVTDIINGKRVLGPPTEILEVKNAYEAYERLPSFDPYSVNDLLAAHKSLMSNLNKEAGRFRSGGVGIFRGGELVHMAPPAEMVPHHIRNLLHWVETSEAHPLVKSCVFHYEFEFIHPFADGNGRIGRLWNTLLLYHWKPIFAWMPVETVIHERQDEYYSALGESDRVASATPLMEFLLKAIRDVLKEALRTQVPTLGISPQMQLFLNTLGSSEMSASEIMRRMGLRNRPSFRKTYLRPALGSGLIEMTLPDRPNSRNQKYRRCKH